MGFFAAASCGDIFIQERGSINICISGGGSVNTCISGSSVNNNIFISGGDSVNINIFIRSSGVSCFNMLYCVGILS